jgi:hypothetical protein
MSTNTLRIGWRWPTISFSLLLLGLSISGPTYAEAGSPPDCPESAEIVTTVPPTFGRSGEGMQFRWTVQSYQAPARVTEASVALTSNGIKTVTPVTIDRRSVVIILPAGPPQARLGIEFSWEQDAGTGAACHGIDRYTDRVVPAHATAGNPLLRRLEGRFAVLEKSAGKTTRATWHLSPTCEYFACPSQVHSTGGLKGVFKPLPNGGYELERSTGPSGTCTFQVKTTNTLTGEVTISAPVTVRRAFIGTERVRLRETGRTGNSLKTFAGTIHWGGKPTLRAERKGCKQGYSGSERVTGRRLSWKN